jgi:hypothetical protein
VAELLVTFCPPAEPSERAFRLGVSCLEALLAETHTDTVVAYAEFWILFLGGVLPSEPVTREALGINGAAELAGYRRTKVTEIGDPVSPAVSGWLDRLVRDEAERPLRALSFYRQTANDDGRRDGSTT